MQHTIKRAVQSAYENFTSSRNTFVAQLLIIVLLGVLGLSIGQYLEEKANGPMILDWRQSTRSGGP
jgi:hypothetical protein